MRPMIRHAVVALAIAGASLSIGLADAQKRQRMNPVIELLEQRKPVFGVYWPSNPQGHRGAPPPTDVAPKPPAELARQALAYRAADLLFNGSMEGGVDRAIGPVTDFVKATADAGALTRTPFPRFSHPLIVKTPKIAPDTATAVENIGRELKLGVSGIMFVEVESADEVRAGLSAMRFKSNGGTRPDDVGMAPSYWGINEQDYKR